MPEFTAPQKEAIYTRDCDLLVSAAAGSGKTAVLSERVLQMVMDAENPVSVENLLIVTFTNAAAAEMKDRITGKLSEALENTEKNDEMRRHLARQIALIGKASITTIHAFCLEIIKNNFHLLNIDPAFRIADTGETALMKLQTADETLEAMYASPDAGLFSDLCAWLGGGRDDAFAEKIINIHEFIQSSADPETWLTVQTEKYNPQNFESAETLEWAAQLKKIYRIKLEGIAGDYEALAEYAAKYGLDGYEAVFRADLSIVKNFLSAFEGTWTEISQAAGNAAFPVLKGKKKDMDENALKISKAKRDKLKKNVLDISSAVSEINDENILEQMKAVYPYIKSLKECMLKFEELFAETKRKAGVIDFSDFEHMALKILRGENGAAQRLKKRYSYIFVDEYQDCNMVQEEIFSLICRKKNGVSCNMFMVGDAKQSIYRFRQAEPTIFMGKSKVYTAGNGISRKVMLNKNFRSSSTILQCVNNIFSKIMSENVGEIEYGSEEMLYYRDNTPPEDEPKSKLLICGHKGREDNFSKEELEAAAVANEIVSLVSKGYKYSDIAVISRSLTSNAEALEEELKKRKIPYYLDNRTGYFETLEVRLFISLLKIVDNPMQDIPLAGVMRSPLFGFDENMLVKIRGASKGMFYTAVLKYAAENNDDTAVKCKDFLNRLSTWRDVSVSMGIDEFANYIIRETGLECFVACLEGGRQRTANLELLLDMAKNMQNSGFKGLYTFVNYIDRLKRHSDSGSAKILSENSNVIRIMTIHKSKGLEFPVVILTSCHKKFNKADEYGDLIMHKELGFGITFSDTKRHIKYDTVSKSAVAERIENEQISEEMRTLYVALTRPKERLICSAAVSNAEDKIKQWHETEISDTKLTPYEAASANCYLDWITAGLCDKWSVEIAGFEQNEGGAAETFEIKTSGSEKVDDILGYKYPYSAAAELSTKFSVSEIKKRYNFEEAGTIKLHSPQILKTPEFIKEKKLTPAQAGIAVHLVLRELPENASGAKDVEMCVERLLSRKLINDEEKAVINISKIEKFLLSETGTRIRNADKVYKELAFNIESDGETVTGIYSLCGENVLVQGIIDCVFVENEKAYVVDYKTDKHISPRTMKMYEIQLGIYARAAEKILKIPVCGKYLYLLSREEVIEI